MYPPYEQVVDAVRRAGLSPGNIICYSYYGSQLLGTATTGSDTDVLVIVDTTPNTGSTHTPTMDARIIPATRLEQGMRGFFDVWAAGLFNYPKNHINKETGVLVCHPWAAMVRSWRPSLYQAAQDAQRITRTAEKSLNAAITRGGVPAGRILKLCRRTVKQHMVAQKLNTYLKSIYTPNTTVPTYTPLFTAVEQKHLTQEATALYNMVTTKDKHPTVKGNHQA